jgi:hypothetical protein
MLTPVEHPGREARPDNRCTYKGLDFNSSLLASQPVVVASVVSAQTWAANGGPTSILVYLCLLPDGLWPMFVKGKGNGAEPLGCSRQLCKEGAVGQALLATNGLVSPIVTCTIDGGGIASGLDTQLQHHRNRAAHLIPSFVL